MQLLLRRFSSALLGCVLAALLAALLRSAVFLLLGPTRTTLFTAPDSLFHRGPSASLRLFARGPHDLRRFVRCVRPFVFAYRFKHSYLHEALSILLLLLVWPGDFLK